MGPIVALVCAAALPGCDGATDARSTIANTTASTSSSGIRPIRSASPRPVDRPSSSTLTAGVAHCAPPDGGSPWAETGRITDRNRSYVMLAHADDPARLDGALVLLAEGGCQADLLGHEVSAAAGSGMPRPDDAAYARLVDQDFQWRVDRSGDIEGLRQALLEGDSDHLEECAPAAYAGCVPTWFAERLRARGVRVDAPSS